MPRTSGTKSKKKSATRVKAGKKAAASVKRTRGEAHFREIGRKGATKANAPAKSRAELARIRRGKGR